MDFLSENSDRSRIHVSEIMKEISIPEDQIKKHLLELTKAKPEMGRFDYPTGWFERPESPINLIRTIRLAWILFIVGLLLFFVPIIMILLDFTNDQWELLLLTTISFLSFWIFLSAIIYLLKLYLDIKDSELTVFAVWRRLKP